MRLTFLVSNYPPEIGSAAHLFQELAEAMVKRDHQVRVITTHPRIYALGDSVPAGLAFRIPIDTRIEHGVEVSRIATPLAPQEQPLARALEHFIIGTLLALYATLSRKPDCFFVYSPPLPLAFGVCILGRLRGIPVAVSVQDLYPQTAVDLGLLKGRIPIRFFEWMEGQVYTLASRLTAHSEKNAKHIMSKGASPRNVHVIYNWVDTEAIYPVPRDNNFRRRHGLNGKFVVTFAGIMSYPQDVSTIVEAAAVLQNDRDVVFLMVGDGPRKSEVKDLMKRLALNNVILLPLQPKEAYAQILAASNVCLVTLKSFVKTPVVPSKLQSILAAGRAPIVSAPPTSDARRIVEDFDCGIYVPPEDPEKLAEAIAYLKDDGEALSKFEVRAREVAEQIFSLRVIVTQVEGMLESRD